MNVLIFGASGGIGKWAINYALQNGHQVTAYVRHPEKMQIADDHLTIMQGELTDKEKITRALSGQDAVIWCVGIPMKRSYPGMNSLEGHRVLIQAMKEQGVKRLIGAPPVFSLPRTENLSLLSCLVSLRGSPSLRQRRRWCRLGNCSKHRAWIGRWCALWPPKMRPIPEK